MKKQFFIYLIAFIFCFQEIIAQTRPPISKNYPKVLYGTASFYANKFEGRQTANGEIFSQKKLTAACNVLPLGTWIRVTNLRNGRSVVVKVNDRLHYKMKRVADLSAAAAKQIGHRDGLTRVKVEVIDRKKTS
ncbi:MAG TPA: septal ring lytic transglycosylase RlpA family protein [Chitinophagaceae bacterium]|nr:septal ring lytic transglycosylase RlpA family protein [Chitinophagaceae bacterium]